MSQTLTNGTSEALTVSEAADRVAALLSDEEDTQSPETLPTPRKRGTPAPEAAAPAPEETDESEQESDDDEAPEEDAEESEDGEESDEDSPPAPRLHRIKNGDTELEVPEDELHRGYLRTSDYTRKTQALADERRAFESEQASIREARIAYAQQIELFTQRAAAVTPAEPDWDTLRTENPEQFAYARAVWQQHKEEMAAVAAERGRLQQEIQRDEAERFRSHLASEQTKLVAAIPAWKDSGVATTEMAALREFAQSIGYTDAEIDGVVDHRNILLLRKAMQADRVEKARPAVKQRIEQVVVAAPSSSKPARAPVAQVTRDRQRLAKTGSIKDAAKIFEHFEG